MTVKDSPKSLQTEESIMDDYQHPPGLEKRLDYLAKRAKRQAQIKHAERKIEEQLKAVNERLNADLVGVTIQRQIDNLYLQFTAPLKPGRVRKDEKEQIEVPTGCKATLDGLKEAERQAREIDRKLTTRTFKWKDYSQYFGKYAPKNEARKTIRELMPEFKEAYFLTRQKNRQSLSTFNNHTLVLNRLPLDVFLSKEVILEAIIATAAGSGARVGTVNSLSVFCKTIGFEFDFNGYTKGYVPKYRILPTDEQIIEVFQAFKPNKYHPNYQWRELQWTFGMIATYGLRPHEVLAVDLERYTDSSNTRAVLYLNEAITDGVKTGERFIFPLNPEWIELFDLQNAKPYQTNIQLRNFSILLNQKLKRRGAQFPAYNLRHRYAVRGHELGVPIDDMARWMGHSVDMHVETYQKYMTIDTHYKVFDKVVSQRTAEVTEVERLRSENADLKAEIESLNARLAAKEAENQAIKALLPIDSSYGGNLYH